MSVMGKRLRYLRKKAGLTQLQLGEMCGLSDAAIRQYEAGRRKPKVDSLVKICRALNADLDYLSNSLEDYSLSELLQGEMYMKGRIDAQEEAKENNNPQGQRYDEHDRELLNNIIDNFMKLNDDGKQKAVERVEELTYIPKYQKNQESDE